MFGFGKRKKQQEAIRLVSLILKPIYEVHYRRAQPVNLARVIVEQSFHPETPKFAGRTLGSIGAVTHAAEALRAGYTYLDVGPEAQSACAAAFGLFIRRATSPGTVESLSPYDHEALSVLGSTLALDRQWEEAMSRLPEGRPVGV